MTRCQEAAFACVLLTVPRPWRGSFLCSAHVCEVRAVIWPCVYRDTRVGVCSLRADGPASLGAHGTCPSNLPLVLLPVPVAAAVHPPVGTDRCCRRSSAEKAAPLL